MTEQATYLSAIVAIALIAVGPALGIWTSRSSSKSQADNTLRFGNTVTGLSAAAAGNSAFVLVGALGLGYTMGVSALFIALGFWIGDILFWYLLARKLIVRVQDAGVEEISELVAAQSTATKLLPLRVAALGVVMAVGLYCVAQFLAVGKITIELFGFAELTAMSLVVTAGLVSILLGGLASSIVVNVYQATLMIVAALLLLAFVGMSLLANPQAISSNAEATRLLNPLGTFTPFEMLIFSGTFVFHGFLFATCNPNVLARITKGNVDEIPKIRWIYMGFMQSLWWLMTLTGVALALLGVTAADPDGVGVAFAQSAMAAPLLGLLVAGIAAASMSTGEAQLLVVANALTKDVFPKAFNSLREKGQRLALIGGRLLVAVILVAALTMFGSQQIGALVIQASSIVLTVFAVPAMLFVFDIKIDGRMMALTMLAGAAATIAARLNFALQPGQEIYFGGAAAIAVMLLALTLRHGEPA